MAIEIKAPTFPESVQEGTLATWHKNVGDSVTRDELIVDIETDKVVLEVVAQVPRHAQICGGSLRQDLDSAKRRLPETRRPGVCQMAP